MTRVEVIRRQIRSGQYRDYMDRSPDVLDAIVERAAYDVLRDEMRAGGEDIPPVLTGQGVFQKPYWPKPGVCPHRGWWLAAMFVGLSCWAMVARLMGWI